MLLLIILALIVPWAGFMLFFKKTQLGEKIVEAAQQEHIIFALLILLIILACVYIPAKLLTVNAALAFIVSLVLSIPPYCCEQ